MKRSQRNALTQIKNDVSAKAEGPQLRKLHLLDLQRISPKTKTQTELFDSWQNARDKSMFLYGSAGTGKTFLSLYTALYDLLDKNSPYDKIVIVRSVVPARDMGFLPGSAEEKMAVYEAPYIAICSQLFGGVKTAYEHMKRSGQIVFEPTSFLRGQTFDNTIVIVDESQNLTFEESNTVITRMGENSKIIFCGDSRQNDLHYKKSDESGFARFLGVIKKLKQHFKIIEFKPADIVRSGLVKSYILALEKPELDSEKPNEGLNRVLRKPMEKKNGI